MLSKKDLSSEELETLRRSRNLFCRLENSGKTTDIAMSGRAVKKATPDQTREEDPMQARSCHSMDSILSVQNKDFTGDGEEFTKVPRAVAKNKSYFFGQFIGVSKIL